MLAFIGAAAVLCAARAARVSQNEEADSISGDGRDRRSGHCCCDARHYSPPQCAVVPPFFESGSDGSCPRMDLFPNDGIGDRTLVYREEGLGCNSDRGVSAALGAAPASLDGEGSMIEMAIPEDMRFMMLVQDSPSSSDEHVGRWLPANAALFLSRWRLALRRRTPDTFTARPVHELVLEVQADGWNRHARAEALPLSKVAKVTLVVVDGRPAVELLLHSERQLLLVPLASEDLASEAAADLSVSEDTGDQWSLAPAPGLTRKGVCCCKLNNCWLAPRCRDFLFGTSHTPLGCAVALAAPEDRATLSAAEELGAQLARATASESGGPGGMGPPTEVQTSNVGILRVLYRSLPGDPSPMRCHSEGTLRGALTEGWSGDAGVEVRTFKAREGGSGAKGVMGLLLDVWGRHQHVTIGSGESCIDLVRHGAGAERLEQAGCSPYRTKSAIVAVVRECLDTVAHVERTNVRAWSVLASAYVASAAERLEASGYSPGRSWQKLLAKDVARIEDLRVTMLEFLKEDHVGVWPILQRASVYAQRFQANASAYMENVHRKLDDVDKTFWDTMWTPVDRHVYPHSYNNVGPRDIIDSELYRDMVDDNGTFHRSILPHVRDMTPQGLSMAVAQCVNSQECVEVPLLLRLMQQLDNATFWKRLPVGWLGALAHAPEMYPTPPSSSKLIFPRSVRSAFGPCFAAPHEATLAARDLAAQLRVQVEGRAYLKKSKRYIFDSRATPPRTLRDDAVLEQIGATLEDSAGSRVEDVGALGIQGALACYPTLFGSLGMEMELRDETGYGPGGKRPIEMEQVLKRCSVAPHCARLAVERLLHFNTKRWERYARVKMSVMALATSDEVLCSPDSKDSANCQVFTHCYLHEVQQLCDEMPGCCATNGTEACTGRSQHSIILGDLQTVLK